MAFQTPDDPEQWIAITSAFIQRQVESAGAQGVVIGLSGGLDSSVMAVLAAKALGPDKVLGVVMPAPTSDPTDRRHAFLAARHAGIQVIERSIGHLIRAFDFIVEGAADNVRGNAKARCRAMVLYGEAQKRNFLVCGTGNKSEVLTGYFTKYGDGGVDVQPIGDLYKTQVRQLAAHLGVPDVIIQKAPSAGLTQGQTDEADLGMTYDELDRILKAFELNHTPAEAARKTALPREMVDKVEALMRKSEHKRSIPLIPKIGAKTVGVDWDRSVQWDGGVGADAPVSEDEATASAKSAKKGKR